jgi:hypothetical protein
LSCRPLRSQCRDTPSMCAPIAHPQRGASNGELLSEARKRSAILGGRARDARARRAAHEFCRAEWPYKASPAQRGAWSFGTTSNNVTQHLEGRGRFQIWVDLGVRAQLLRYPPADGWSVSGLRGRSGSMARPKAIFTKPGLNQKRVRARSGSGISASNNRPRLTDVTDPTTLLPASWRGSGTRRGYRS